MSEIKKNNGQYTAADIEKYLLGELSPDEMHAIEKAALDDPFLADAIEGVRHTIQEHDKGSLRQDIAELKQRLEKRIADKKKAISFFSYRGWWQAAAVIIVLAIIGVATYLIVQDNHHAPSPVASVPGKKEDKVSRNSDSSHDSAAIVPSKDTADMAAAAPEKGISVNAREAEHRKRYAAAHKKDTGSSMKEVASVDSKTVSGSNPQNTPAPAAVDKELSNAKDFDYSKQEASQKYFLGKVTDKYNRPIASASIELNSKRINTLTDKNGNFRLDINGPDSTVSAEIKSAGYDPAFINLSNGISNNIILHESKSYLPQLSVSVDKSGKKVTNQIIPQDAEPVIGWEQYNLYLDNSKKPPEDSLGLKGTVLVSFLVGKNMKPSDFVIEQSIGPGYDEEAIRLIKAGSPWKLRKKKTRVFVVVNF